MDYANLFEPFKIGKLEIENRFFMSPMFPFGLAHGDGRTTKEYADYYIERAKGGMGLIITGLAKVDNTAEIMRPTFACVKDPMQYLYSTSMMVQRIHSYGTKIFLQVSAGWGRALWPPFAERLVSVDPDVTNVHDPSITHTQITTEEVERIVQGFAMTSAIAKATGFDGVEVHAVHEGYLLDQFATEYFNHRTDKYGGSFENRYRFAVEIVQAIKAACGQDFPVSLRYSPKHFIKAERHGAIIGEDFQEIGRDMPEGLEAAQYLTKNGYDALNVDVGSYDSHFWSHPTIYSEDCLYLPYAAAVKEVVDVPILCAGKMDMPNLASQAVADGKIDMVGLGRPSLADPYYVSKLRTGREKNIRWCINCNVGCGSRMGSTAHIGCAVNPACGYETERSLQKLCGPARNVVVIGGGPGGMEAANTAAKRGHKVTLLEREAELGGNLITASGADFKYRDDKLIEFYKTELNENGVDVRLNTEATRDMIEAMGCDVLIMATGANAIVPAIPGRELNNYLSAGEVLMDIDKAGKEVAIIGGGQVGVETAIWLARHGRKVCIIEMLPQILTGVAAHVYHHSEALIKQLGINVFTDSRATEVTANGIKFVNGDTELEATADTIIYSVGYKPENKLYKDIYSNTELEVYNIGDSSQVSNVYDAIHSAYEVANNI